MDKGIQSDGSEPQQPADPINDYCPQARSGHRAPHGWLERQGQQISTLDLYGRGFVVLVRPDGSVAARQA